MKLNEVQTVVDSVRGCGWRKAGGLYLRCDGVQTPCGKLPVPLAVCPCCSAGIKPARGWVWFDPRPFVNARPCSREDEAIKSGNPNPCVTCPLAGGAPERAGLLWVGEKFYATPTEYMAEAKQQGISRRINRVPHGYKIGDRVYLAHRIGIADFDAAKCDCQPTGPANIHTEDCAGHVHTPAIFTTFVPDRIEYVCKGDETENDLDALVERGLTPVKVIRDMGPPGLPLLVEQSNQSGQPEFCSEE